MAERGHTVAMWCYAREKREIPWRGVRIRTAPHLPLRHARELSFQVCLFARLVMSFARQRPDLVYVRNGAIDFAPVVASGLFRIPLVIEFPGPPLEEGQLMGATSLKLWAMRRLLALKLRAAHGITAVTEGILEQMRRDFETRTSRVAVIENGANTDLFQPVERGAARALLGLTLQGPVVCFVGNLHIWQGLEVLVEAVAIARRARDLRVLIVGGGPLRRGLEERAASLGLTGTFAFTGSVDYAAVPLFISASDVGVAPLLPKPSGDSGYSPLKVYEYLACGRPVVASRVKGLEFIEEQHVGRLAEPNDPVSLAEALVTLVKEPESERDEMGARGRRLIEKQHTWGTVARRTETYLGEVLATAICLRFG